MHPSSLDSADLCLRLAETASPEQRRILLDLAAKWLAKAPQDAQWAQLSDELSAWKRTPC